VLADMNRAVFDDLSSGAAGDTPRPDKPLH
jgi:hypothetical protein